MTLLTKRRHCSSSSDSSASCIALRPKCPLPTRRLRKVARQSTSHCIAVIAPSLQQHRSKDPAFSSSDTEVSSGETELGTALSEVESALPVAHSSKSHSDGEMDISSPSKEENEVEDDLASVGMSSPSPSPRGWVSSGKMPMMWKSEKGRDVEDRAPSDIKRRKIYEVVQDDDAEADDEMEETESVMATPKQKQKTRGSKKPFTLTIPTPSIQRITDGFNGLTPYSKEMQFSPDSSLTLPSSSHPTSLFNDDEDEDHVFDTLIPSPTPGPSRKRIVKHHVNISHTRPTGGKKRSHSSHRSGKSTKPVYTLPSMEDREKLYAEDPFCHPQMTILHQVENFGVDSLSPVPPAEATSTWSYGPLSSPIRLAGDIPQSPIRSRILLESLRGQRTKPNKNLQRRSPTSLIPSRHRLSGRFQRARATPRSSHRLLPNSTALAGQLILTQFHLLKDARNKRRHAVARQNAQVDHAKLAAIRARCFEYFSQVEAWRYLLDDIGRGCWWWPVEVEVVQPSVDEVQVDCLVGNIATEAAGDTEAVLALINTSPVAPGRRSPSRDDVSDAEAEAHQARAASRAIARQAREAEWTLSSERAAAQRRRLGRSAANPPHRPVRHVSALNPAWLQAVRIPALPPPAPTVVEIPPVELEETDVDSDSDSESAVSDPPEYDSGTYPRHIPFPINARPRQPPSPVQQRLPSYAVNRYTRRSPSPPPPYNAATDRQTLVAPQFVDTDSEDEEEATNNVVVIVPEPRVVGAFPSSARWSPEDRGRSRFDAALEMEEGEDADLIDELTANAGFEDRAGEGVVSAIGGFFGRFFGRR